MLSWGLAARPSALRRPTDRLAGEDQPVVVPDVATVAALASTAFGG
jgi:hypothetical protein